MTTHIIKGSQVCVTFTLVAYSHSDESHMHGYDGVPCLLDIISGSGMILRALDEEIASMQVSESRLIIIPAVDAHQTARALGIHILGLLKYELKVLRVVNIPADSTEISEFLRKRRISLETLSETKAVKKGPFNILRTYCMFEANAISEEYRILESLYKRRNDERSAASHSSHSFSSSSSSRSSDNNSHNNNDKNDNDSSFTNISRGITVNCVKCYSGGGDNGTGIDNPTETNTGINYHKNDCSSSTSNSSNNNNNNDSSNSSNINSDSNNNCSSDNSRICRSKFLLPSWTLDQPKELFLPELLRLAVTHQSRIVILFDAPDDWDEVSEHLVKYQIEEQSRLELFNLGAIQGGHGGIIGGVPGGGGRGGKEVNLIGGETRGLDEGGIRERGGITGRGVIQGERGVIEADVDMLVESEETDSTRESVLTWLRVALETAPEKTANTASSLSSSSSSSSSSTSSSSSDNRTRNPESNSSSSNSSSSSSSSDNQHSQQSGLEGQDVQEGKKDKTEEGASSINIVSGISMGQDPYGYRVALLRFSGWVRGCAPQERLWEGFWRLYERVMNEVIAASAGTPLSIIVVDVGAIISKHAGEKGDEGRKGDEGGKGEKGEKGNNISTAESDIVRDSGIPLGSSQSGIQDPSSNPLTPDTPNNDGGGAVSGAEGEDCEGGVRWGAGDRASLFILLERIAHRIKSIKSIEAIESINDVTSNTGSKIDNIGTEREADEVDKIVEVAGCPSDIDAAGAKRSDDVRKSSSSSRSSSANNNIITDETYYSDYNILGCADTVTDFNPNHKPNPNSNPISLTDKNHKNDSKGIDNDKDKEDAKMISARLLAAAKLNIAEMDRHMMDERVKAKARLACRLRARDSKQSTNNMDNTDTNNSDTGLSIDADISSNMTPNPNDNTYGDSASVSESADADADADAYTGINFSNSDIIIGERLPSIPTTVKPTVIVPPVNPPGAATSADAGAGVRGVCRPAVRFREVVEDIIQTEMNGDEYGVNGQNDSVILPPPPPPPPSSSSALPPPPPHVTSDSRAKEKRNEKDEKDKKEANDEKISLNIDSDKSLCVPELLYDLMQEDNDNHSLQYLFVTHAQYKFAYKMACELNKKK